MQLQAHGADRLQMTVSITCFRNRMTAFRVDEGVEATRSTNGLLNCRAGNSLPFIMASPPKGVSAGHHLREFIPPFGVKASRCTVAVAFLDAPHEFRFQQDWSA